jgi:hypothetical protein
MQEPNQERRKKQELEINLIKELGEGEKMTKREEHARITRCIFTCSSRRVKNLQMTTIS